MTWGGEANKVAEFLIAHCKTNQCIAVARDLPDAATVQRTTVRRKPND